MSTLSLPPRVPSHCSPIPVQRGLAQAGGAVPSTDQGEGLQVLLWAADEWAGGGGQFLQHQDNAAVADTVQQFYMRGDLQYGEWVWLLVGIQEG